jgi:KTSC domain
MPSTVIRAYNYDAEAQELTITFVTGRIYVYLAVPSEAYDEFSTAFSKGTFFNKYIRDAYDYREITPGKSLGA